MNKQYIFTGIAFTTFLLLVFYKLNFAPLWYDETIEYWFSKIMFGELPFDIRPDTQNMYQRIITTFQPPLYNLLMWIWLHIHDGVLWFRLSGVIFGLVGMVGLYKVVKVNTNAIWANLSVIVCAFTYQLIYYFQECAEYSLLLCLLFWMLYFYSKVMREQTIKNIIIFIISAILPIYTQYGAVFIAIPLLLSVLIEILTSKNRTNIKTISIAYTISFIVAAIPLIIFFLIPQMTHQQSEAHVLVSFKGNILTDFIDAIFSVVISNFFFIACINKLLVKIFIVIVLCLSFFVLIKSENKVYKHFILVCYVSFILYYIAVKLGVYAVNTSGNSAGYYNRYSLFFIPQMLVMCFICIQETYHLFQNFKVSNVIMPLSTGTIYCLVCAYCLVNWHYKLYGGMEKIAAQDPKGAVECWYEHNAYNDFTIIDNQIISGFLFYERHHKLFDKQNEQNFIVNNCHGIEEQQFFWSNNFGNDFPDRIYAVSYTYESRFDDITIVMEKYGYKHKELYSKNNVRVMYYTHDAP